MSYLTKADLLLLVYDVKNHPDQLTNAHKILEYLASGKVIVSSFINDYANKSYLLEMPMEGENFSELFRRVMLNLASYNKGENRTTRINYAKANAYSTRVAEIETLVMKVTAFKLN
jgi:hypothetical protein